MDWKIELLAVPVTDINRAKAFYTDQLGYCHRAWTKSFRASDERRQQW